VEDMKDDDEYNIIFSTYSIEEDHFIQCNLDILKNIENKYDILGETVAILDQLFSA